jgi:S-(hydroxymethyl)glutathione dehydrogenase / alcohol dehydrogenase
MKAVVFYEPNVPVSIETLEIAALGEGEVLLDIVAAGVCHSDYHLIDGHRKPRATPWVMGHEGAGIVAEVGPGVKSVAPGDRIILSIDAMCGYCRNCTNGSPALCETYPYAPVTRMTSDGIPVYHVRPTFVEQTIALEEACVKVPDDTPLDKACLIGCAVITGIGAVINRAKVETGASMAVFGCGGVGLNVIQGGVLAAASKIIAVDKLPFKLELARQMGATHFINADTEDPVQRIKEITRGGADYAFEAVGFPALVRQAIDSVRPTGTAVVAGIQPSGQDISVEGWHLLQDRTLMGCFHGSGRARTDFLWILDLYKQGKINLDELISRYRPLDEINEAFDDLKQGSVARTVLLPR